ncbi:DUF4192 family protein [Promicromonospora sp. MS192]|uniref:DUF4192 family protein n=1 Tax=Promicromonospora sp. MS192 TaxID=3412684 RepID=UPI003C2D80CF
MPTEPSPVLGRYLAQLPYVLGHQPDDDQVVTSLYGPRGVAIVHAAVHWDPDAGPGQAAGHFAQVLKDEGPIDHVAVTGYGPDGGTWAFDLATELCEVFDARSTVLHVQDGSWRVLDNLTETWGPRTTLPTPPPDLVLRGAPTPAASRNDLVASVAPLPEPLFTELDQARATYLTTLSPTTRADLARTALDHLASGRVDDVNHLQSLAHLVSQSTIVRDTVIAHAIHGRQHRQRVDALIRTFRAAPPSQRPALATTAAAVAYLTGWPPPQVEGLLRHTNPAHRLANLVSIAHHHGARPEPIRRAILKDADNRLQEADAAWTANQTRTGTTRPTEAWTSTRRPPEPPLSDAMGI